MDSARNKIILNQPEYGRGEIIDLANEEKIEFIIPNKVDDIQKNFSSYFHKAILGPPMAGRSLRNE